MNGIQFIYQMNEYPVHTYPINMAYTDTQSAWKYKLRTHGSIGLKNGKMCLKLFEQKIQLHSELH